MSKTRQLLDASRGALPAIKAEVVNKSGVHTWRQKVRKVLVGVPVVALGIWLTYRGVELLVAEHDVGKWLVAGGVAIALLGVYIWDNELIAGALKSVPALLADGIAGIVNAFRRPPAPPSPPTTGGGQ